MKNAVLSTKTLRMKSHSDIPDDAIESDYTSRAHEWAKMRGWFTFKVESPTMNGLPDRFYARRGVCIFIEWKKKGGPLRTQQKKRIKEMREHDITVYVLDDFEEFKRIME